ncbi:hypothetical protein [Opitutus sp. ER46]|uniref:hypothetical protein n=1 Tax=Opitutus sp. ER46 TaxID=2161864 RepID=UPI000D326E1A|nr:hypothetical protein [Opitutus sp. ER46]PTX91719.1 hypothetical protein DB354_17810 [Opitutus sp. ER46]
MTLALAGVIALTVGGLALIGVNGRKLLSDWPRPKPVHNVDLAWIQVYLGLALLVVAYLVVTDPARVLFEPTPTPVAAEAMDNPAASSGRPSPKGGR